jgi:hypothetical protein
MITCYNPYGINWMRKKLLPKADKDLTGPKNSFLPEVEKIGPSVILRKSPMRFKTWGGL